MYVYTHTHIYIIHKHIIDYCFFTWLPSVDCLASLHHPSLSTRSTRRSPGRFGVGFSVRVIGCYISLVMSTSTYIYCEQIDPCSGCYISSGVCLTGSFRTQWTWQAAIALFYTRRGSWAKVASHAWIVCMLSLRSLWHLYIIYPYIIHISSIYHPYIIHISSIYHPYIIHISIYVISIYIYCIAISIYPYIIYVTSTRSVYIPSPWSELPWKITRDFSVTQHAVKKIGNQHSPTIDVDQLLIYLIQSSLIQYLISKIWSPINLFQNLISNLPSGYLT